MDEKNIDYSHLVNGTNLINNDQKKINPTKIKYKGIPLDEILIENSKYHDGPGLKKKLINAGLMEDICVECLIGPIYNNKPLSLQLDHINGIHDDNRIHNLRILCPNCHSQTETYGSKNKAYLTDDQKEERQKKIESKKKYCITCKIEIDIQAKQWCVKCSSLAQRKVERPS